MRVLLKPPEGSFSQQCILKGHGNWIRGLAAAHIIEGSGKVSVYVASASQDRTARLWKIAEAPIENGKQECSDAEDPVCMYTSYFCNATWILLVKQ